MSKIQDLKDKIARMQKQADNQALSTEARAGFAKAVAKFQAELDEATKDDKPAPAPTPAPKTKAPKPAPKAKAAKTEKAPKAKEQTQSEWEDQITTILEKDGMTRSDAQGIVDANEFTLSQCWAKGMTAKQTADKLFKKPINKPGRTYHWMEKIADWEKTTKAISLSNNFRVMEVDEDAVLETRGEMVPLKKGDMLLVNEDGYPVTFFTPGSSKRHVKPFAKLTAGDDKLKDENEKLKKQVETLTKRNETLLATAKVERKKAASNAPPSDPPKNDDEPKKKRHSCNLGKLQAAAAEGGDMPAPIENWLDGMAEAWKAEEENRKVEKIYYIKETGKIVAALVHYNPFERLIGKAMRGVDNPTFHFVCPATTILTKTTKPEKSSYNLIANEQDIKEAYSTKRNWDACRKLAQQAYEACSDGDCTADEKAAYKKLYYNCGDSRQKKLNREKIIFIHQQTRKDWKKGEEGYYEAFRRVFSKLKKEAGEKWPA